MKKKKVRMEKNDIIAGNCRILKAVMFIMWFYFIKIYNVNIFLLMYTKKVQKHWDFSDGLKGLQHQ